MDLWMYSYFFHNMYLYAISSSANTSPPKKNNKTKKKQQKKTTTKQKTFVLKKKSGIPLDGQAVWIQISPFILSDLVWVQTSCKCFQ